MAPTLGIADLGDLARRACRIGMDQRLEAVLLQEVAALGQRLDVALHRLDGLQRGARQRHQAVLDPLEVLGHDLELGVRQQAVQVGDPAGDRVLDRDDGQLRLAGLDRAHGRIEGRAGQRGHVGKGRAAGHVRVGAGFALEGDDVAGGGFAAPGLGCRLGCLPGHMSEFSPRSEAPR